MKRIAWIALGWLPLLTIAQAASFDCEKASNHVEKLICTDEELSKLDEQMAGFYETALLDKNWAGTVRQTQKQWLKERNSCSDAACVKSAYLTRMRNIFPDNKARAVLPPIKYIASIANKDWAAIFVNSKIGDERANALQNINALDLPDGQKYNEIGLHDSSPKVRGTAAYSYHTELDTLTPILLKIITGDPDPEVRSSAAANLSCQFSCNGADYQTKDVRAFESELSLIPLTLRDEEIGKAMLEILDSIWCDMSKKSQKSITKLLRSDLSTKIKIEGGEEIDNTNLDLKAKSILHRHLNRPCSTSVQQ